jgi:hypothetical protein
MRSWPDFWYFSTRRLMVSCITQVKASYLNDFLAYPTCFPLGRKALAQRQISATVNVVHDQKTAAPLDNSTWDHSSTLTIRAGHNLRVNSQNILSPLGYSTVRTQPLLVTHGAAYPPNGFEYIFSSWHGDLQILTTNITGRNLTQKGTSQWWNCTITPIRGCKTARDI